MDILKKHPKKIIIIVILCLFATFKLYQSITNNDLYDYKKDRFLSRLEEAGLEPKDWPGYNIADYAYYKTKYEVNIYGPDELDDYIKEYKSKDPRKFNSNLYDVIHESFDNDYMVITAMYNLFEKEKEPEVFPKHKEFIMNEYMFNNFYYKEPGKDKNFKKLCNIIAEVTHTSTKYYNANKQYRTTIELINLVLKERKPELEETLKEKLAARYAQALFKQKKFKQAQEYLKNAIQEYQGDNEALLKQQLAKYEK